MSSRQRKMHVDPYERAWMIVSVITLAGFLIAITIAGLAGGIQVPGPEQQENPNIVATQGPIAEPGLRELAPGKYEAYVVARTFQFIPRDITIPVGSEVKFYVTSIFVQHGFKITETNVNMMVIPGQVSTMRAIFDEPGEHLIICHEYCGAGHAAMFG
ncbi:MAG: cytochrome c oxidase subunit II, partial [Anaerolineae bacterium]